MKAHNFPRVSPDTYKVLSSSTWLVARPLSACTSSVGISDSMIGPSQVNALTICLALRCTICARHLWSVRSYSKCQRTQPHTSHIDLKLSICIQLCPTHLRGVSSSCHWR